MRLHYGVGGEHCPVQQGEVLHRLLRHPQHLEGVLYDHHRDTYNSITDVTNLNTTFQFSEV